MAAICAVAEGRRLFHCWRSNGDSQETSVSAAIYDFESDGVWRSLSPLRDWNLVQSGIHCDSESDRIYLGGGMYTERAVRCYDLERDFWSKLPDTVHSHSENPAIWGHDVLYIAGHSAQDIGYLEFIDLRESASKWMVAPDEMQISSLITMPTPKTTDSVRRRRRRHRTPRSSVLEIRRVFV